MKPSLVRAALVAVAFGVAVGLLGVGVALIGLRGMLIVVALLTLCGTVAVLSWRHARAADLDAAAFDVEQQALKNAHNRVELRKAELRAERQEYRRAR